MINNYDNFFLPATDLEKGREFYKFGNRLGITDYSKRPDLASKKNL